MAKIVNPSLTLGNYQIYNGNEGRFPDPFYADRAQVYLLAGVPWSDPIWVYGRDPVDHTVSEFFYIPSVMLPGQIGWRWSAFCKAYDVSKDANNDPNYPPQIELEAWRTDLAAELSLFTSAIPSKSLPFEDVAAGSNNFDGLMAFGKVAMCSPQVLSAPFPVVAAAGILQLNQSNGATPVLIKVTTTNLMIGWIGGRPVFSGEPIADW